jgi:viologen exporter family transport system permease protein
MRDWPFDAGAVWAFVALGWQRAAAERAAMIGRLLLYSLILAIFWQLWQATPLEELAASGPAAADLLWYVAITEWIVFAAGSHYRSVEGQITNGDVERALVRPVPYAIATLAEWAGTTAFNLLTIGACGVAIATWLTGRIPMTPATVLPLILSAALASAIVLLFQLQLGYAAAWMGTSAPLFWIWQKLLFVLGGLLIPLSLYPEPLRAVATPGPFAAMLFAPGSLVLTPASLSIAATIGQQAAWLMLMIVATVFVDRAASARFADRGS